MRFDLTDLRLFLAVADAGSITRGAAQVGLSLPAASERLRDMELAGGVRLLERGRRGATLTDAGEALTHHARLILNQMALMRGELGEHARGLRSTVRLLANTAAGAELLPLRLAPWLAAHPQVDLDLRERQSFEIARSVAAGFADIGVLSDAAAQEGLSLHPFAEDRLAVVAPADDALARMRQVRLAEVADRYFIGLSGGALQDHIEAQAAGMGLRLKYRVKLRSFGAICHMVGAGAGIGIVPETAARRLKRATGITAIRLGDAWARRRLSVCIAADARLAAPAQSLFAHLVSGAAVKTAGRAASSRHGPPQDIHHPPVGELGDVEAHEGGGGL